MSKLAADNNIAPEVLAVRLAVPFKVTAGADTEYDVVHTVSRFVHIKAVVFAVISVLLLHT